MKGHLFVLFVLTSFVISCDEPKVEPSFLYGVWEIREAFYDEEKIEWGDRSQTKEYIDLLNAIKDDISSSKGERWQFNADSSFYSESSDSNPSYWIYNNSMSEIQFSSSKEPFDIDYFFKLEVRDDIIIVRDVIKDVGTITTILKKTNSQE